MVEVSVQMSQTTGFHPRNNLVISFQKELDPPFGVYISHVKRALPQGRNLGENGTYTVTDFI